MAIEGLIAVAVINNNVITVSVIISCGNYGAAVRSDNRRAVIAIAVDVNTAVVTLLPGEGVSSVSEAARARNSAGR